MELRIVSPPISTLLFLLKFSLEVPEARELPLPRIYFAAKNRLPLSYSLLYGTVVPGTWTLLLTRIYIAAKNSQSHNLHSPFPFSLVVSRTGALPLTRIYYKSQSPSIHSYLLSGNTWGRDCLLLMLRGVLWALLLLLAYPILFVK